MACRGQAILKIILTQTVQVQSGRAFCPHPPLKAHPLQAGHLAAAALGSLGAIGARSLRASSLRTSAPRAFNTATIRRVRRPQGGHQRPYHPLFRGLDILDVVFLSCAARSPDVARHGPGEPIRHCDTPLGQSLRVWPSALRCYAPFADSPPSQE